jgi:hydrogenase assembly chaperone HypC/HupF
MCLTIPKKVLEIRENSVVVENPNGKQQEVRTIIPVKIGDFVLTQGGIAVESIEVQEALQIIDIIKKGDK